MNKLLKIITIMFIPLIMISCGEEKTYTKEEMEEVSLYRFQNKEVTVCLLNNQCFEGILIKRCYYKSLQFDLKTDKGTIRNLTNFYIEIK